MEENKVTITHVHSMGSDEIYAEWFMCPDCGNDYILGRFNYCPNCGAKIIWKLKEKED